MFHAGKQLYTSLREAQRINTLNANRPILEEAHRHTTEEVQGLCASLELATKELEEQRLALAEQRGRMLRPLHEVLSMREQLSLVTAAAEAVDRELAERELTRVAERDRDFDTGAHPFSFVRRKVAAWIIARRGNELKQGCEAR